MIFWLRIQRIGGRTYRKEFRSPLERSTYRNGLSGMFSILDEGEDIDNADIDDGVPEEYDEGWFEPEEA